MSERSPIPSDIQADQVETHEQVAKANTEARNFLEYAGPAVGLQLLSVCVIAFIAIVILRNRKGYLPEWARVFLGVRRTLHSRSELRPKPSPFQPRGWK
jgi:hypothetical protein